MVGHKNRICASISAEKQHHEKKGVSMNMFKKIFVFIIIAGFAILYFAINDCSAEVKLTPEAQKLYDQWTELIGYSNIDLTKKNDPAPEIKPGLVITPENYKDYPGLKKLLPQSIYKLLDRSYPIPIEKITVVETRPRFYDQDVIEGSRLNKKTARVNPDTLGLEGWGWGVPFRMIVKIRLSGSGTSR